MKRKLPRRKRFSCVWKNLFEYLEVGDIIEFTWEGKRERGRVEHWYITSVSRLFHIEFKPLGKLALKSEVKKGSWEWHIYHSKLRRLVIDKPMNKIFEDVKIVG